MTANPAILEALQASLKIHWTAIVTYSREAAQFKRWGYSKLAAAACADVTEEQEHAARLMARLEFFDVAPDGAADVMTIPRHDLPAILSLNLDLESLAGNAERAGILTARETGDEITAHVFADNLDGSEKAIAEIEAAQKIIAEVGLDNYLANQV